MTDSIRCPACRGSKKVPKLGGMIGQCNTCNGKGTILAVDKPVKVDSIVEDVCAKELINAVAQAVPVSDDKFEVAQDLVEEPAIKVDPKKALYRRKTGAK